MLKRVQSLNFKSLYCSPNTKFTEAQFRSIDNIKSQMSEELYNKDYYVTPNNSDEFVDLYRLKGNKPVDITNFEDYKNKEYIGSFDEYHVFNNDMEKKKRVFGVFLLSLIVLTAALISYVTTLVEQFERQIKPKMEQKNLVPKDSLNNLKDTLKLVKK